MIKGLNMCLIAMKTRITGAKIACLDMNLQKHRMNLGVNIVVDDPDQLEEIRKRYDLVIYIPVFDRRLNMLNT